MTFNGQTVKDAPTARLCRGSRSPRRSRARPTATAGTWTIAYDVEVENTGAATTTYDLIDTPNFGAGVTIDPERHRHLGPRQHRFLHRGQPHRRRRVDRCRRHTHLHGDRRVHRRRHGHLVRPRLREADGRERHGHPQQGHRDLQRPDRRTPPTARLCRGSRSPRRPPPTATRPSARSSRTPSRPGTRAGRTSSASTSTRSS